MTVLTGVPVDRIEATAAEVDFGRGARRVVAALWYYPARFVGVFVASLAWGVAAAKVGYADGRGKTRSRA